MNKITLDVQTRSERGKGPARRWRMQGKVPAIFYGKKTEPIAMVLDLHEFKKATEKAGHNPIFEFRFGDADAIRRAVLKERQIRPVDGKLLHLDFMEVHMDESIEVTVPIEYVGDPIGVEKGGAIQVILHKVRVRAMPDSIPESIKVDLSGVDLGHSLHIGEVEFPAGVVPAQDPSIALVSVPAPKKDDTAAAEPGKEA